MTRLTPEHDYSEPHDMLNMTGMVRHGEKWVFIYRDGEEPLVIQSACRMADDLNLSWTLRDVESLAKKLEQELLYRIFGEKSP
jgi:hypothetical protein